MIKSYAFLFVTYSDIKQENVLKAAFFLLILTILLYNQILEDYYLKLSESLVTGIQQLESENDVLQKYANVADLIISGYQ